MSKALIKKTGEILDVKSKFQKMTLKIDIDNFPDDLKESLKGFENEVWIKTDTEGCYQLKEDKGTYYILSDGNKYYENEVVTGTDNIREYKLKNIIK